MNTHIIIYRVKAGAMTVLSLILLMSSFLFSTSCTETDSSLVEYVDDNKLNSPNDTVYSLVGIINKMQMIADRTILLGELRGDLAALNANAELDLQDIANFKVRPDNPYIDPRDYYAVIQNCNYFIANADTTLSKRGEKIFAKELGVVRAYRAWTYMQLVLNYGSVPFFTEPILTEKEGDPSLYPAYGISEIADYFIKELAPYVDTKYPDYGSMDGFDSKLFFIPVRVLLGDLCLWSGRYVEAATYYHDYLTMLNDPRPLGVTTSMWTSIDFQGTPSTGITSAYGLSSTNTLMFIPMAAEEYDGIESKLADVFTSTADNNYYYQADRSKAYLELSSAQRYVMVYNNPATQLRDTISPAANHLYSDDIWRGDLRMGSVFTFSTLSSSADYYSKVSLSMRKFSDPSAVVLYRLSHVYLRYAEALNRMGVPEAAFAVLKYGLSQETLLKNINGQPVDMLSPATREKAGNLIDFSQYSFTASNTMGIHSRGCGNADADTTYVIPELATLSDSILFVEDKICDEMALETAFEGVRYYDLMRLSLHRGDASFLAGKVAARNGEANFNEELYSTLSDQKNWYLPLE